MSQAQTHSYLQSLWIECCCYCCCLRGYSAVAGCQLAGSSLQFVDTWSGAPKEFWFLVGRCNKDCWLAGQLASATIITRKCNKQRFSNVINIRTTFRCFYFIAVDSLYHWAFRSCDWEVAGVRSEHCDCSGQLVLFLAQCELAAIVLIAVHGVLADL